jgi:hypothetical protein
MTSSTSRSAFWQRLPILALKQAFRALDDAAAEQGQPFHEPALIRPNMDRRFFNVSHYGVMIPDLPEPFKFFSLMAIIGNAGNRFIDSDHMLVDRPSRNATQVSGTAAMGSGQFGSYSIDRDCEIRADGSLIRFGHDVTLTGLYPDIRLQVTREGFTLDIALTCLDNVTWFARTPVYKHLGLMADYRGHIEYQGRRTEIAGACTYEYFTMLGPYGVIDTPLPPALRMPTDFFTYQIVALYADTQLMLAKVGGHDVALLEAAWLRGRDQPSQMFAKQVKFEVTAFEAEPRIAPDGSQMLLPKTFTWTVKNGNDTLAVIHGSVDTPFIYGLCRGYVGGYRYTGEFKGQEIRGRGYIEYVDCD